MTNYKKNKKDIGPNKIGNKDLLKKIDDLTKKVEKKSDYEPLINKLNELIDKIPKEAIKPPEIVIPDKLLDLPQQLDKSFSRGIDYFNRTDDYINKKQMDYFSLNTNLIDTQFNEIIQRLQSQIHSFSEAIKAVIPTNIPEIHENYIYRSETVTSSKSVYIDVNQELGRIARYGYIVSDSGTISFRLNEGSLITLNVNDRQNFLVEDNLRIYNIRITSTTSNTFRIYLS